jgi:hypothetical protein
VCCKGVRLRLSFRCVLGAFLVVLMLAFFSGGGPSFCVFAVDEAEAGAAVADAEERVVVCYRAVADADGAGANVTGLLGVLDEAGLLLSRADLAFMAGDFDSAFDFAVESQEALDGFVVEADALRDDAIQQRSWDFMVNVVGSVVGAAVVVFGSYIVWLWLKRRFESAGRTVG